MTAPQAADLFASAPREWGRWGPDDEIGRANLLDAASVVASAAACIRSGKRFSLALPLCRPGGDPTFPGREASRLLTDRDEEHYRTGRATPLDGDVKFAEDSITLSCHGTTHMDALGHAYTGDQLWNGYPADSTVEGLSRAGVGALAAKGVVGRAVLVDVARAEGVPHLDRHRVVSPADIRRTLELQHTELRRGDVLVVRTGILTVFYDQGADAFYDDFDEPGLTYSPELLELLVEHDVVGLGSDTLCNERQHCEDPVAGFPLHVLLQRNLGISFHEALWLEAWAADSAEDGIWDAFYVAAPLNIVPGTGAPMNPIVIK